MDLSEINQMLFFDIETVSCEKDLQTLRQKSDKMFSLWEHRCLFLRDRYEENSKKTCDDLYKEKAGLHAEFSKIVCISFGMVKEDMSFSGKTFCGEDERDVIEKSMKLIDAFFKKYKNARIAGHNVKRFDIPVLCKRAIINKVPVPAIFDFSKLKPWEIRVSDTAEIWSHGAWQESFTSLDLLCAVMDVTSPKQDMNATQVQSEFHVNKDYEKISRYCEADVLAIAKIMLKISGIHDPVLTASRQEP